MRFQFPRSFPFINDPILLKFDMNIQLTDTKGCFCPKLVVAPHFWIRFQRALYFSPNFEHLIIVRFLLHFRCPFLSRSFIVHFCPKLVVAPHFWLRLQRALYFYPNFEHFIIVRFWLNLQCMSLSQFSIVIKSICITSVIIHQHCYLPICRYDL